MGLSAAAVGVDNPCHGESAYYCARVDADPERVERGLAQLVLTLIDFLRRLMESQALRRMEEGTLTDEEIERMGTTFMRLDARMEELKRQFGLEDEDLNLNLGPLGDLM